MIRCSACGFQNPGDRERCVRCSTALRVVAVPDIGATAEAQPEIARGHLATARRTFVAILDALGAHESARDIRYRWPFGALLLAFAIPGGGQFYTAQRVKGLVFAVVQAALTIAVVVTFFKPNGNTWLLIWALWAALAAADAWQAALQINGRPVLPRYVFAYWFAFIFAGAMWLSLGQWFVYLFGIRLVAITSNDLAPAFVNGDRVLVVSWPLWFGRLPQRGDIVDFSQESYSIQKQNGDVFVVHPIHMFGVVSGLPGDVIEWKDRTRPLLNGAPVPDSLMPLNPDGLVPHFHLKVPEEKFAVLPSTSTSEFWVMATNVAPNPYEAGAGRMILTNFERANIVDPSKTLGVAILRYNPPERREWFGYGNGLWGRKGMPPSHFDQLSDRDAPNGR